MITLKIKKKKLQKTLKILFWFFAGAFLGLFLFLSFVFIVFQKIYFNRVYPGITINGIDVGGKTENQVSEIFAKKNDQIANVQFIFSDNTDIATVSAKELSFGYNQNLIARQAIEIGRGNNFLSNVNLVTQAYLDSFSLDPSYQYSEKKLLDALLPFMEKINKDPVDALFTFKDAKVTTFRTSENGQAVNIDEIKNILNSKFSILFSGNESRNIIVPISIKIIQPEITTDKVNNLGIKELIGKGSSLFQHSIPGRIFNVTLASSRVNGILVAPNEEFSFNKALGDVSSFTGYKQAYIIQNGKTVLGDGGGVCQVSTTFFRALLDAGLPIIERRAHAYRVGYYEQDGPPGFDATIYVPTVDLKFKNDTDNYILMQTEIDQDLQKLSFFLYGTKDERVVEIGKPIITNIIPPPEDVYQDDPSLPKGTIKQIDYKAEGSRVSFTRRVTKNGKEIISDKFTSNYSPWRSVFLRGTKE